MNLKEEMKLCILYGSSIKCEKQTAMVMILAWLAESVIS